MLATSLACLAVDTIKAYYAYRSPHYIRLLRAWLAGLERAKRQKAKAATSLDQDYSLTHSWI